jgi:cytochrome c-type biogenesis protein CcmE
MKPKHLVGLILGLGIAVTAVIMAVTTQQTYVTYHVAAESGDKVQVRGTWVKEKGCEYHPEKNLFTFTMKDEAGNTFPVHFADAKPNNFELAEQVVVGGSVDNGTFVATSLLTKCPSKYEADSIPTQAGI